MFEEQTQTQGNPPQNLPTEPVDMFAGLDGDQGLAATPAGEPVKDALSAGLLKPKVEATGRQTPPNLPLERGGGEPSLLSKEGTGEVAKATAATPSAAAEQAVYAMKAPILGKVLVFVVGVVVLGGLGFGGFWVYGKFLKKSPAVLPPVDLTSSEPENTPVENLPPAEAPAPVVAEVAAPTATAEIPAQMKNDSILFGQPVDTDKDGLDDIREREIGTNLANVDTDADGLSDSDEVLIWKTDPLNPDSDGDSYVDGKEVRNGYNPLGPGKLFNAPASVPSGRDSGAATPTSAPEVTTTNS